MEFGIMPDDYLKSLTIKINKKNNNFYYLFTLIDNDYYHLLANFKIDKRSNKDKFSCKITDEYNFIKDAKLINEIIDNLELFAMEKEFISEASNEFEKLNLLTKKINDHFLKAGSLVKDLSLISDLMNSWKTLKNILFNLVNIKQKIDNGETIYRPDPNDNDLGLYMIRTLY